MTVFTLCRSTVTSSTAEEEMVNLKKKIQFKKKGFTLHRERKNTNFLLHHLTALRDQSETKNERKNNCYYGSMKLPGHSTRLYLISGLISGITAVFLNPQSKSHTKYDPSPQPLASA